MVKNVFIKIINILSIFIIGAAVLILLNVVMTKSGDIPNVMGYSLFRVMTGSMEPTIPTDSVIVTHAVDASEIEVGDVVSYFSKDPTLMGAVNTHRVVDIYEEEGTVYYQTRGDANNAEDGSLVHYKNVIGTPVFTIPGLGYVANYIQHPPGTYVAISAAAVLLLLAAMAVLHLSDSISSLTFFTVLCIADGEGERAAPVEPSENRQ